jgi:hypothetical protein
LAVLVGLAVWVAVAVWVLVLVALPPLPLAVASLSPPVRVLSPVLLELLAELSTDRVMDGVEPVPVPVPPPRL